MLMRRRNEQRGVTIVELLIGMVVGILVIGGGITVYVNSVQSSNQALRASKLNQEMSSLLLIMSNDIRRAGYWATLVTTEAELNPFNAAGATALTVRNDMTANAVQPPTGQGSCILYSYDATYVPGNIPGTVDATDLFGFRLNGTTVQMRQTGTVDGTSCVGGTCNSCTNGVWQDVTDANLVEVTNLTFDLANSQCLNSSEPNGADDDGNGTIDDADEYNNTQATATQSVRVRNNLLRIR